MENNGYLDYKALSKYKSEMEDTYGHFQHGNHVIELSIRLRDGQFHVSENGKTILLDRSAKVACKKFNELQKEMEKGNPHLQ